ncbi:hypothetical protein ACPESV_39675 [Streptomyces umbrinus]|uniref:hypothetical protein n=1 Tax=Streptomyces umbrinus TaxID=67370 RepID=UPI003C2AB045
MSKRRRGPPPTSCNSVSKCNRASGAGTPRLRGSPNLIITDRPYGTPWTASTDY